MTGQSGHFLHRRVLPNNYLIEGITMRADNLICCLREHKIADLRASVNALKWLHGVRVPESNTLVSGATTRSQQTSLIRVPSNCLDGCFVLTKLLDR